MQLQLSFSVLLASILALAPLQSSALPAPHGAGMVSMPLRRMEQPRGDVHPLILLQHQMNRAHKRYALMTGRQAPSNDFLEGQLRKRVLDVEGPAGLAKRYNRVGVPAKSSAGPQPAEFAAQQSSGSAASSSSASGFAADALNGVEAANAPSGQDSIGLNIEGQDVGYLGVVQMGTPPREFLILMDSGSADLWVGSQVCQSEAGGDCGQHQFLGSKTSTSFQASNQPFEVTYGTGNVQGAIVQDDINVAGLKLQAHTFGVATQESEDFSADTVPFDGLMGLAKSTLSQQQTLTPVESLAKNGLIQEAITSFKIPRAADNNNDGEVTFGGLDSTKFDANTIQTLQVVNDKGFWEADMQAVTVGGKDTGLQGRTAILDTGTTLIVAPPDDAAAVHSLIEGAQQDSQGGFVIPCDTTSQVALTFGKQSFAIDTRDLAIQPVQKGSNLCVSGISSGTVGAATEWLVGDVFLKNAYFSTNVDKNTIQLAKLV